MASQSSPSIAVAKQAVNQIVTYIHKFKELNISEIIEAGSLGDGTVVPGHYDIDLVVYSRSFSGREVRPPHMYQPWISRLKAYMERFRGVRIERRGDNAAKYSVEFSYTIDGVAIEVDLLISPFWIDQHEFYRFLQGIAKEERMNYSVCASKWQRLFFKKQSQVVKEYIRKAKAWRNRQWGRSPDGKPKSYLLSLLVLRAYEDTPVGGDAHRVTQALRELVKSEDKDVYWADGRGDFYKRSEYKDLLPSRPRIVDPANPANNVWVTGFCRGGPNLLIKRIDTIDLSRPIAE